MKKFKQFKDDNKPTPMLDGHLATGMVKIKDGAYVVKSPKDGAELTIGDAVISGHKNRVEKFLKDNPDPKDW